MEIVSDFYNLSIGSFDQMDERYATTKMMKLFGEDINKLDTLNTIQQTFKNLYNMNVYVCEGCKKGGFCYVIFETHNEAVKASYFGLQGYRHQIFSLK